MHTNKYFKAIKVIGFTMAMTCWATIAAAMDTIDHSKMDHSMMAHSQHNADEHAKHRSIMNQKGYSRKEVSYQLPDVKLIDQNGNNVSTVTLLDGKEPVMLNFIFTSCTTICPVLSATFAQLQKEYNSELNGVKMISISIDPEYDTPARLKEYAQRFYAQEGWTFLTGDLDTVITVLNSFDAYRGDKMNHIPLTFIHTPDTSTWIRLEGFANASDLIKEYQTLKTKFTANISQR